MRTTLDINDVLLLKAKERSAATGKTLTAIVEEGLAALLSQSELDRPKFSLELETDHGRYVGGVDLADRDALYNLIDAKPRSVGESS